jgi:hypothetical protein
MNHEESGRKQFWLFVNYCTRTWSEGIATQRQARGWATGIRFPPETGVPLFTTESRSFLVSTKLPALLLRGIAAVGRILPLASVYWSFLFMSMGWNYPKSVNCSRQRAYFYPPGDIGVCVWTATVEWYWQGKTDKLGKVHVPLCSPQIPRGLTWASMIRGRWLTAWAVAYSGVEILVVFCRSNPTVCGRRRVRT